MIFGKNGRYYTEVMIMKQLDLPLGFGMALAQNENAMKNFEAMTEAQKEEIIKRTHDVNSKDEMQRLVNSISNGKV